MNRYRLVYYRVDDPCEPGGLPKSRTIEIDAPSAADAVYIAPTRLRERPMDLHIVDIVPLPSALESAIQAYRAKSHDQRSNECSEFPPRPCIQCGCVTGGIGLPFVATHDGRFCHKCYNTVGRFR